MGKVFVDSNVFFYAKIMDGVFGGACAGILRNLASGTLQGSTSALVPIEVANALRKYGRAKDVAPELRAIHSLGIEIFAIDSADAREAADIYDEAGISPYDCVHAAVMKRNGMNEIVSADREFDKVGWIKRLDPRDIA